MFQSRDRYLANCQFVTAIDVCLGCRRSFCGDGVLNRQREECDGLDIGASACATYKPG